MNKRDVLVDTVFLLKLSQYGKEIETFKRILDDLDFSPVVHPYIANHELDMYPFFDALVKEGYIRVFDYDTFLPDEEDREYYEARFVEIHNEIREYLKASGGKKQLEKLALPSGQTVFTYRKAGMSLGDVHMILMAFFLKIPVILTEDSDIELLRGIARRRMGSASYQLDIINAVDVILLVAKKQQGSFSKKGLVEVVKGIGERGYQSKVKQAWSEAHQDE